MADSQELIAPMEPGKDHPQHAEPMRKVVTEELVKLGEDAPNVRPQGELADEVIQNANDNFSKVVGVESPSDQTAKPQKEDSDGLDDLGEIVASITPGEAKVRTVPTAKLSELRAERVAGMNPPEEAK